MIKYSCDGLPCFKSRVLVADCCSKLSVNFSVDVNVNSLCQGHNTVVTVTANFEKSTTFFHSHFHAVVSLVISLFSVNN